MQACAFLLFFLANLHHVVAVDLATPATVAKADKPGNRRPQGWNADSVLDFEKVYPGQDPKQWVLFSLSMCKDLSEHLLYKPLGSMV